jgi:hypothetical protein
MDPDMSSPTRAVDSAGISLHDDRAAAEQALETAQRNPILSAEQACALAQVYALLAVERRLAQLFDALVTPRSPSGHPAANAALVLS